MTAWSAPSMIQGVARQPEAAGRLNTTMFLIIGLCEGMYFINLAFMALFVFVTGAHSTVEPRVTTVTLAAAGGGNNNFLLPNATFFVVPADLRPHPVDLQQLHRAAAGQGHARARGDVRRAGRGPRRGRASGCEQAEERYESALAEARAEATADQGRGPRRRRRRSGRRDARRDRPRRSRASGRRAKPQLAEQRSAAVSSLRGEIGGLSTDLAGRILGTPMGADGPQKTTIESFLAELDAPKQSVGGKG